MTPRHRNRETRRRQETRGEERDRDEDGSTKHTWDLSGPEPTGPTPPPSPRRRGGEVDAHTGHTRNTPERPSRRERAWPKAAKRRGGAPPPSQARTAGRQGESAREGVPTGDEAHKARNTGVDQAPAKSQATQPAHPSPKGAKNPEKTRADGGKPSIPLKNERRPWLAPR